MILAVRALLLLLPVLLFFPVTAHAGLVVRLVLEAAVDGEVAVKLASESGDSLRIILLDDGAAPDVLADDLHYSGSGSPAGSTFEVTLSLAGDDSVLGTISFPPDSDSRDLVITRNAGLTSMEAGVPDNDQPPMQAEPGSPPEAMMPADGFPDGAVPSDAPPVQGLQEGGGGDGPGSPPLTFPGAAGGDNSQSSEGKGLYILFGLGLLALIGVAVLWFRGDSGERLSTPIATGVKMVAEPGLLGPGTPSMSDGMSIWRIADAANFIEPLLQTMAVHHRVLVVAGAQVPVPGVYGGPVFRSPTLAPGKIADICDDLEDGRGAPLCVLMVDPQPDAESLEDLADMLPPEVGVVVLCTYSPSAQAEVIDIEAVGDAWKVAEVMCRVGELGLERVS